MVEDKPEWSAPLSVVLEKYTERGESRWNCFVLFPITAPISLSSLARPLSSKTLDLKSFFRHHSKTELKGDTGVYGIAVLSVSSPNCGISVTEILACGIAVSFGRLVCRFSSFKQTVFGIAVPFICALLSHTGYAKHNTVGYKREQVSYKDRDK